MVGMVAGRVGKQQHSVNGGLEATILLMAAAALRSSSLRLALSQGQLAR